jgi:hypothetical protein
VPVGGPAGSRSRHWSNRHATPRAPRALRDKAREWGGELAPDANVFGADDASRRPLRVDTMTLRFGLLAEELGHGYTLYRGAPGPPLAPSGRGLSCRQGDRLLVGHRVGETAVHDADQPVAQSPKRLMMGRSPGPWGRSTAARGGQRRERPQVAGIHQPMVACRPATTTVRRPENPVNGSDARGGPADDARMTNDRWIALVYQAAQRVKADTLTSGVHLDVHVGPRVELEAVLQRQLEARWGPRPTWLPGPPGVDDPDPGCGCGCISRSTTGAGGRAGHRGVRR